MLGLIAAGVSATAILCAGGAMAADPVDLEVSGQVTGVAGVSDGEAAADADADIEFKGSSVLGNGVEVGAVVEARLDGQQPNQIYAGGRYSSMLIGGPRGVGPNGGDAYVQGAYAYARGAFGKVIVGRDHGVGRTFAVKAPTIFRSINVNDWRTDLSGLNDIHTVNDFSGYSTKLTYLPPANFLGGPLGGLQMGVSYSPASSNCANRSCNPNDGLVIMPDGTFLNAASQWEDVIEAAMYYQKEIKLAGDGLLVGLGASYVTADENTRIMSPVFGDYEGYSLGLNLAFRGITLGGSVKTTNLGLSEIDNKDEYLAFDAGIAFQTGDDKGDWGFMLGYGQSEANAIGPNPLDPTIFRDTQTAQAGVTYFIGRGITIGAAAQFIESTKPAAVGGPEEAATVVLESSIKF